VVSPLGRHRLFNDVEGFENPTAEMIAAWFFQRIERCESVRVCENDNSLAHYPAHEPVSLSCRFSHAVNGHYYAHLGGEINFTNRWRLLRGYAPP